jgi:transcriptional regulator with GAF, ATPase, and Fis domain
MPNTTHGIGDPGRVAASRRLRAVAGTRRAVLQRLVDLAAELAEAPVAFISIVGESDQVFLAERGLPEWAAAAGTTLDQSICQEVVARGRPLIAGSLADDPERADHPAVVSLDLSAYVGLPVFSADGHPVGALAVADDRPREWSQAAVAELALLADVVSDELELQDLREHERFEQTWNAVPAFQRR